MYSSSLCYVIMLNNLLYVLKIKGTMLKRVGGSRWLGHMKVALESLFLTYPAFISHLLNQSNNNANAEGLAKLLASLNVMVFAIMLYVSIKKNLGWGIYKNHQNYHFKIIIYSLLVSQTISLKYMCFCDNE